MSFFVNWPDILLITALSIAISAINIISYRFIGNYEAMKQARKRMNEIGKKMRKGQATEEHMNELSKAQSEYMKHSMKPMLVSFILITIMFPFFAKALGDVKILNNTATLYGVNITIQKSASGISVSGPGVRMISSGVFQMSGRIYSIHGSKISHVMLLTPFSLPLVGNAWGWLATYLVIVLLIGYAMRAITGTRL